MFDTRSTEYVKWMANVWRLNDLRNKRIEEEKRLAEKAQAVTNTPLTHSQ